MATINIIPEMAYTIYTQNAYILVICECRSSIYSLYKIYTKLNILDKDIRFHSEYKSPYMYGAHYRISVPKYFMLAAHIKVIYNERKKDIYVSMDEEEGPIWVT